MLNSRAIRTRRGSARRLEPVAQIANQRQQSAEALIEPFIGLDADQKEMYSCLHRDEQHRCEEAAMNWFVSEQVSADSMIQASIPVLELLCVLAGIVALLLLLIALLHTIVEVRSSSAQHELHRFGDAKQRIDCRSSALAPRRKLLPVSHLRGWMFTR